MDAQLATKNLADPVRSDSVRLARGAALGLISLIWLVAIVLCISRATGGIRTPPEFASAWMLATVLVMLTAGARQMWRMERRADRNHVPTVVLDWAALPAMALAGWATAPPGADTAAVAGFMAIVLVAESYALRGYFPRSGFRPFRKKSPEASTTELLPPRLTAPPISDTAAPSPELGEHIRIDPPQTPAPHFPTEDVAQQLVRRVDEGGNDVLEGWVRAAFAPRQRTASVHVAFCPTLEGELSVEFEQIDGEEARVRAAQVLPYGVRFDVKLDAAAERAESVLIEFVVRGDAVLARTTA